MLRKYSFVNNCITFDCLVISKEKSSMVNRRSQTNTDIYPFSVTSYYYENSDYMNIMANISYDYYKSKLYQSNDINFSDNHVFMIEFKDSIASMANYNRSMDHSTIYVEADLAAESFNIATNIVGKCYDRYYSHTCT